MPTIANCAGRYLLCKRPASAGNNLRPARSPVAPNRTSVNGSGGFTRETNGDGCECGPVSGRTTVAVDMILPSKKPCQRKVLRLLCLESRLVGQPGKVGEC